MLVMYWPVVQILCQMLKWKFNQCLSCCSIWVLGGVLFGLKQLQIIPTVWGWVSLMQLISILYQADCHPS